MASQDSPQAVSLGESLTGRGAVRAILGIAVLGLFAALWFWAEDTTDEVRHHLSNNVFLIAKANKVLSLMHAGGPAALEPGGEVARTVTELRLATHDPAALDALRAPVAILMGPRTAPEADFKAVAVGVDHYVLRIRQSSSSLSSSLDEQWSVLRFQAVVSVVMAGLTLLVALMAERRRLAAESLKEALERTAEAHRRAREEAETANAVKVRFLANLSHELRTPLVGIIGLVDLMGSSTVDPVQRQQLDTAGRSSRALLSIISDILDFSKMDAGRLRLDLGPMEIRALVDEAVAGAAVTAQTKHLDLVAQFAPDVPLLWAGDAVRLRQVLTNLISNGVKFTDKGSVLVRVSVAGEALQLQVSDTGVGIDAAHMPKLFIAFSQVDDQPARRHGGTGLGLAISRELVVRMGGRLDVSSQPGVGTTFTVTLPRGSFKLPHSPAPTPELRWPLIRIAMPGGPCRTALHDRLLGWGAEVTLLEEGKVISAPGQLTLVYLEWLKTLADQSFGPDDTVVALAPLIRSDAAVIARSVGAQWVLLTPVRDSDLRALVSGQTAPLGALAGAQPVTTSPDRAPKVLVVEDDAVTAQVVTLMLRKLGCEVDRAADGQAAVVMGSRDGYDVILMDCQLPIVDGVEACRRIRAAHAGQESLPPIVAMTASALDGDAQALLHAGMDDFMAKPVSLEQLRNVLLRNGVALSGRALGPLTPVEQVAVTADRSLTLR